MASYFLDTIYFLFLTIICDQTRTQKYIQLLNMVKVCLLVFTFNIKNRSLRTKYCLLIYVNGYELLRVCWIIC